MNRKKMKKMGYILITIVLVYLIALFSPYLFDREVSQDYADAFDTSRFYSDTPSGERAMIIEDNGNALEERLRLIANAKNSIILSTFDFQSDTSGKQILAALQNAAFRGINIQIIVDGYSAFAQLTGNPYFYALSSAPEVTIKVYNPVNFLKPWNLMSRMHDKYLIVDETYYISGGRNTYDYFLGAQDGHKNLDRDLLVVSEKASSGSVQQLLTYFNRQWNQTTCKIWHSSLYPWEKNKTKEAANELKEIYKNIKIQHSDWLKNKDYTMITVPVNQITLLSNPIEVGNKEPYVFYGLTQLMQDSSEEIVIHTPYIICNKTMYQNFSSLISAGKHITLMTNSIQNNGNPFGSIDYLLHKRQILDTGLNVLEYEGGISYHGKSILIDNRISIIGSFNMDIKSYSQDTELMLVVDSPELNEQLKNNFLSYHEDSVLADINPDEEWLELLSKNNSPGRKILLYLIKWIDPVARRLF